MPKSVVRTGRASRGLAFIVAVALVCYMLASVGIAVTTVKDCKPYDQHWNIVPPHWICERGDNVFGN